jgi:uncharacterized protein with PQ loop repeat
MDVIKKCFGWLAFSINISFYLSPLSPFINVLKGKLNFEETPGLYVTTSYINCLIFYIYGRMRNNTPVKFSYMISGIISLILLSIYLIFESKRYLCDSILNTFFIVTGTWIVYRALILIIDKVKLVGYISIFTTVLLFLSPVLKLNKALKEKNYNLLPAFSSWRYLFSSISWIIYAIFLKDYFLISSNIIGIIFSLFNIFINICYKKKHFKNSRIIERRNSNGKINSSNGANDENKKEEIPIKLEDDCQAQNDDKPVNIVNKLEN